MFMTIPFASLRHKTEMKLARAYALFVVSFESVHRHTTKARGGEWAQCRH
jgi:hypothetical protein